MNKGRKIYLGLYLNWIEDTGTIPDPKELLEHMIMMEDEEFNAYLDGVSYNFRKEMQEEGKKQLEKINNNKKQ